MEGSGWLGRIVLGPEFIFKLMFVAGLLGVLVCELEEAKV